MATKLNFTKKALEKIAPAPAGKRTNYFDSAERGLVLRVTERGAKSFVFVRTIQGKNERIFIGEFPGTTIEQARGRAAEIRAHIFEGRNPAEEKRKTENTVESVANEWIKRHLDTNVDWPEAKRILLKDVVGEEWKDRRIDEIGRADILRLLDKVIDRGSPTAANRVLAVTRAFMNWCVQRGILTISPCAGITPPTKEQSRDRVLTADEMTVVLTAADTVDSPFVRFLAMTAQRRGECARVRWAHIDLDKAMWTLPKEETKAGRVHDVPLSKQAVALLQALPRHKKGDFVFSTTEGKLAINGFSKLKVALDEVSNIAAWTFHDLRRTAATNMAEAKVPPHIVSAILNHSPGSSQGVTSIYNRFRYVEERRAALQAWADQLDAIMTAEQRRQA